MTWQELIDRLLIIQKARDLPANWLIAQVEMAGHPPKAIWRAIAKALKYSQYWADWRYLPGHDTEEPDLSEIDPAILEWEPLSPRLTPRPILRPNPSSAPPPTRKNIYKGGGWGQVGYRSLDSGAEF
jgi:hypothetical protein